MASQPQSHEKSGFRFGPETLKLQGLVSYLVSCHRCFTPVSIRWSCIPQLSRNQRDLLYVVHYLILSHLSPTGVRTRPILLFVNRSARIYLPLCRVRFHYGLYYCIDSNKANDIYSVGKALVTGTLKRPAGTRRREPARCAQLISAIPHSAPS